MQRLDKRFARTNENGSVGAQRACELAEQYMRATVDTTLKNVPGLAVMMEKSWVPRP